MAKFKENKFHSKELIPLAVVELGKEAIDDFLKNGRSMYRFCTGEDVVHKQDLTTRMVVQEIVRKKSRDGEKARLDGIRCHWFESE